MFLGKLLKGQRTKIFNSYGAHFILHDLEYIIIYKNIIEVFNEKISTN